MLQSLYFWLIYWIYHNLEKLQKGKDSFATLYGKNKTIT